MPQIQIAPTTTPPGKLADADVLFTPDDGAILAGLRITGFSLWRSRYDDSIRVTAPSRQYWKDGEKRNYAIIRESAGSTLQQDHPLIAVILREYDRATTPQPAPRPAPPPAPTWTIQPAPPVSLYDLARQDDERRAAGRDRLIIGRPDDPRMAGTVPYIPAPIAQTYDPISLDDARRALDTPADLDDTPAQDDPQPAPQVDPDPPQVDPPAPQVKAPAPVLAFVRRYNAPAPKAPSTTPTRPTTTPTGRTIRF